MVNWVGLYGPVQVSKPCKGYEMDLIEVFEGYKMNLITLFRWVCQNGLHLKATIHTVAMWAMWPQVSYYAQM